MGFSLRNFLEESVAQVNPFDKGQTAKTVKNDRQAVVAQTKKVEDGFRTPQWQQIQQKANQRNIERRNAGQITPEEYTRQQSVILGNGTPLQQGQHTFKSQPLIRGAVRDIFDSNSEVDKIKRQQQGLPTLYRDQQIAQGNTRPYENIGAQFLGNTARALNTTAAAVGSIPLQARIYAAEATKNNTALENALRDSQNYTETITDPGNGLLNTGTLWNGVEDFNNASLKENLKRSAINTVGVASEVAPFKINPAKGAKFTTRLLANAGVDAAAGAGESVARQYANTGRVDLKTLAGDVAANTLLGSAQVGGSKLISKVNTPEVRQKATNIARGETAETLQLRDTAIKLQQLYDKTTSTTTRRTIAQQLSDVNAQIRSIKEGGYVGKEAPQVGKTPQVGTRVSYYTSVGEKTGTITKVPDTTKDPRIKGNSYKIKFDEPVQIGMQKPIKETYIDWELGQDGLKILDKPTPPAQVGKTEAIKQAQQIAKKTEALKKQGKITPNDEGYWTTPVKGQPKDPIPNVKDVNGVQVKEGDVIEVEGLLGGKARRTVQWQEPQIANATGELQPGQWLGNGPLDNGLPFKIVKENTTPPQVGKTATNIDNVKLPSGYHTVADITKELKRQGITQKMLDDTQAIDMGTFDNSGKVETGSVLYFLKENSKPNEMFAPQVGKTDITPHNARQLAKRRRFAQESFRDCK